MTFPRVLDEEVIEIEQPEWFAEILSKYDRIGITGGPKMGKTTLSNSVKDRRVFFHDEFKRYGWDDIPDEMLKALSGESRFVVEGVMVARALRRAIKNGKPCPVDAVVLMRNPKCERIKGQIAMEKAVRTVLTEWLDLGGHVVPMLEEPRK